MAIRADSIGLFWADEVKVRVLKEVIKRTPPERTWEHPDYLPGLDEALAFQPDLYSDYELGQAALANEPLVFDSEVNPNYALFAFRGINSKKVVYFDLDNEECGSSINIGKMQYVLNNFCIINFNGRAFDFVITALALAGCTTEQLWLATQMLIEFQQRPQDVLKHFKVKKSWPKNQIDLIDLTALSPGLKVCAGRLHAKRMQDLPFLPGIVLTKPQRAITFMYCFNDLDNTELLYRGVYEQIKVREDTGKKYGLDLRSHSDPQMAEAIIASELRRITGQKFLPRTKLEPGTAYRFKTPAFISFQTPLMNHVLSKIQNAIFAVSDEDGNIISPAGVFDNTIKMGNCAYQMGIGGLHTTEKSTAHVANSLYFIADTDATSYYPRLILNAGIMPQNLGKDFLVVYEGIVVARVGAKAAGNIIVAECLKIVVNGTFGKLGSKWSIMYAPDLMLQVTLTGQLSLLMLAEMFELNGIEVLSANTDGIVTRCLRSREDVFHAIVKHWETVTGFGTEEMRYTGVYSRDVNNYIAIYEKPQKGKLYKGKGVYGETAPKKNAVAEICVDAATQLMLHGIPVTTTIEACTTISKFTSMRAVKGGAVKDGVYLGKIIRWYYSAEAQGEIIYAKTGNKVAMTDGAKPCMDLPDAFPTDINYQWYIDEAYKILEKIGYSPVVAVLG